MAAVMFFENSMQEMGKVAGRARGGRAAVASSDSERACVSAALRLRVKRSVLFYRPANLLFLITDALANIREMSGDGLIKGFARGGERGR